MKKKLRIHSILLGGIMMLSTVFNSYAQDVIEIVSWRFSSPNTAGNELDYPSTYTDFRVEPSLLTRGPGFIPGGSFARGFGGGSNSWSTNNNPTNRATGEERDYFEFKVKGKEGYLSLRSIEFKYRRNNRGANTYQWSYSLNGDDPVYIGEAVTYTGEEADGLVQPAVDLGNLNALKNLTPSDEVTFRLHLWGISGVTVSGVQYLGRYPGNDQTPSLVVKGVISESETTLPVTLLDFTANKEGNAVRLDWSTASETNNSHFEVLHSGNGERFDVIGTISGKGTTSVLSRYSFTDFKPVTGINYYRLRQVDFNGNSVESDTKAVNLSFKKTSLSVSASNEEPIVTLFIYVEKTGNAEVFITSMEGKKIVESSFLLNEGENKLSLPVHLTKGIYIAKLVATNINIVTKFIKE